MPPPVPVIVRRIDLPLADAQYRLDVRVGDRLVEAATLPLAPGEYVDDVFTPATAQAALAKLREAGIPTTHCDRCGASTYTLETVAAPRGQCVECGGPKP